MGPWSAEFFRHVSWGVDPNAIIMLSSAHKNVDESTISNRYYDFLKLNKDKSYQLTEKENDFIVRCRLLRSLKTSDALLHLNSMRDAIVEMFDEFKPDLVISETIDAYVMDLFYEESSKRGIVFIGLVSCFVNGYFRVSARGEYNYLRDPSDDEVDNVLGMLEGKNYMPSFIDAAKQKPYTSVLKRWLRNSVKPPYFALKRIWSGEKYNYHYWATQIVASDWFHLFPMFSLGQSDWRKQLSASRKKIIYVPLQMVPEATVDYWCQPIEYVDYNQSLLDFISRFSEDFHFLVKEHPNVLGFRNPKLYGQLSALENVTICPTNTNTNDIIDLFDSVLVWTGTLGFECALRGKPVITFCLPYYVSGEMFMQIKHDVTAEQLDLFIERQKNNVTVAERKSMVKFLLSGIAEGRFIVDGSWTCEKDDDVKSAITLGQKLGDFFVS